jgi:glycerol-3-phosphate acyltransferase PlsY
MSVAGAHVLSWLAAFAGAYLVGSIPWSWLVVRWKTGRDVREVGSGNVGATNAMRAAGRGAGALALVLDVVKGVAPVLAARSLGAPPLVESGVAAFAVVGHMYPLWLRFRGGKGVATAAGALGALAPLAMSLSLVVFVAVVTWKRYVSLASIAAACTFPLFVLLLAARDDGARAEASFLVGSTLVPLLVVWRHRGNLRRLVAGTERRLGKGMEEGS